MIGPEHIDEQDDHIGPALPALDRLIFRPVGGESKKVHSHDLLPQCEQDTKRDHHGRH